MSISLSRAISLSVFSFFGTSIFMYKYERMSMANKEIAEVKNKRQYLFDKHQELAESYDKSLEWKENIEKVRKTLLTYAEGNVLETGWGTGNNSKYYKDDVKVTCIDWSVNMLQEALGKEYDNSTIQYKLADVESLPFENSSNKFIQNELFFACRL